MQVLFTRSAARRLRQIYDYYARKASRKTALRIKRDILKRAKTLSEMHGRGAVEPSLSHLGLGHRYLVEGNHKIVYRAAGGAVYITDVFDTRQDPSKINP